MSLIELAYLVAIAHVWSRGTIFRALREAGGTSSLGRAWRALATCPLCSGWWIGVLGHALWLSRFRFVIEWLGAGAIVGTLALAVYCAIRRWL